MLPRRTRTNWAIVTFLLCSAVFPATASADSGTFGLVVGATAIDEGGEAQLLPVVRGELTFRLAGPLQFGGFVQGTAAGLPFDGPAFGAGLLTTLRPDLPILGLTPHLEASMARLQLPSDNMARADAWATSVGGGIGSEVRSGLVLELRILRSWYHGLATTSGLAHASWTGTAGLAVDLP